MYHINNDKRQIATAEKIKEGLRSCLTDKLMSEISVSDIASRSGVSRSTFYRSFDTPIDVLMYACDTTVSTLIHDYSLVKLTDKDEFILFTLRYWRAHSEILEAVVNCDRMDIIQKSIHNHSDQFLIWAREEINKEFSDVEIDYILAGSVGMITSMLQVWIRYGKKQTPEELYRLYRKLHIIHSSDELILPEK